MLTSELNLEDLGEPVKKGQKEQACGGERDYKGKISGGGMDPKAEPQTAGFQIGANGNAGNQTGGAGPGLAYNSLG